MCDRGSPSILRDTCLKFKGPDRRGRQSKGPPCWQRLKQPSDSSLAFIQEPNQTSTNWAARSRCFAGSKAGGPSCSRCPALTSRDEPCLVFPPPAWWENIQSFPCSKYTHIPGQGSTAGHRNYSFFARGALDILNVRSNKLQEELWEPDTPTVSSAGELTGSCRQGSPIARLYSMVTGPKGAETGRLYLLGREANQPCVTEIQCKPHRESGNF